MSDTIAATTIPRGLAITHPIVVARAEGCTVWDEHGKAYLDFTSGIGVLNVGHCHPRVVDAVREQAGRLTHECFQVANYRVYLDLAARLSALVGRAGPCKTALFTTGAEAVENAVKIARAFTGRPAVVGFTGGFHGRTLLGLTLTASSPSYRQNFGPFAPDVHHVPYPYEYRGVTARQSIDWLQQLFDTRVAANQVAAVVVEPELGEGGFVPAPLDFLPELRRLTERHGIVLVVDEIQSGFGRTGRMFAYEHSGIQPDLVTIAKSVAGGLPLSAVVGKAAIMDAPAPGGLGGTYAGNPIACAAALAVLDVFEEEHLVERGARIGARMCERLNGLAREVDAIGDVRGLGAMLAVELVVDRGSKAPAAAFAAAIVERARDLGLLLLKCGPAKNVVRFLPPLVATDEEIDRGMDLLAAACRRTVGR